VLEKIHPIARIGAALEIVDHHPCHFRGDRSLLWRALHEFRDRHPIALIDEHHKYPVLVAKDYRPTAADRSQGADPNVDNGLIT
jgi:hypothetical protein